MNSNLVIPILSSLGPMGRAATAPCGMLVRIMLASLAFCLWPQAAWADHMCAGRSNEYTVTEVYDEYGGVIEAWCEWSSDGSGGAAAMRYYSPEEWKSRLFGIALLDGTRILDRGKIGRDRCISYPW